MRKYVFVLNAIELLNQLLDGKRVEGVLYMDQNTGKLTFKAYNRKPQIKHKDVLVKKLPWGHKFSFFQSSEAVPCSNG